MKLIKINTDHYIIVDDSEIKEDDFVYSINYKTITFVNKERVDYITLPTVKGLYKKITHSTQPLESFEDFYKRNPYKLTSSFTEDDWYSSMYEHWKEQQLSLSEVKELIGEVDVEKKAWEYNPVNKLDAEFIRGAYIGGYSQCLEDNKDKKYTEEDMEAAVCFGMILERFKDDKYKLSDNEEYKGFISSLQPKTEWEVEIIDGQLKQTNNDTKRKSKRISI